MEELELENYFCFTLVCIKESLKESHQPVTFLYNFIELETTKTAPPFPKKKE